MPVRFKSPPLVTQEVLDHAAKALKVTLPADYARFLLTVNGGVPTPRKLVIDAGEYTIDRLYSVSAAPPKKASAIASELVPMNRSLREEGEPALPNDLLAIGLVNGEDILVLAVRGKAAGAVSAWSTEARALSSQTVPLASSFTAFLETLEKPATATGKTLRGRDLEKQLERFETAIVDRKWAKARELAEGLDFSEWRPVVHPVFSAISDRDLDGLRQLHEIGVPFDVEDEFEGGTPLEAAVRQVEVDLEFLDRAKGAKDKTAVKKWEAHAAAARSVQAFLQETGLG